MVRCRSRSAASLTAGVLSILLVLCIVPMRAQDTGDSQSADAGKHHASDKSHPLPSSQLHNPVLWEDPGDIASKDLYFGQGGQDHQPKPPFTFISEDHNGTNPKFDAHDADGTKWRVKLGSEARPEVVASRLLWAVGYFVNDDYNLASSTVAGIQMKRGRDLINNDQITDARFERRPGGQKKAGIWRWKENPFKDTKEFNGLRVMMAVMNNWDLKDVNNAVYTDSKHDRNIFLVTDIGATFASNDEHVHHDTDKGNLASYEHSKFIIKKNENTVSFGTPMMPAGLLLRQGPILVGEAARRMPLDWIGHDIPIADARWIGGLLGQLSHKQLEDAFRAGNFPQDQADTFVRIVESRIAELRAL